jgi:hypothetical protein
MTVSVTFLAVVPGSGLSRAYSGLVVGYELLPAALLHAWQFARVRHFA